MDELCWRCVLESWPHADGIASQVSTGGIQCFKNQLFIPGIKGYASNTCVLMTMRWNSSLSCCSFSNCVFKAAVIFWSCFHNRNGINTVNHNANSTRGTDKLQVNFFMWNIQYQSSEFQFWTRRWLCYGVCSWSRMTLLSRACNTRSLPKSWSVNLSTLFSSRDISDMSLH